MITNKVKEYRKKHNLTQEQIAQKVCVTRQTIISIEKNKGYDPSFSVVLKLSKELKTKPEKLFFY